MELASAVWGVYRHIVSSACWTDIVNLSKIPDYSALLLKKGGGGVPVVIQKGGGGPGGNSFIQLVQLKLCMFELDERIIDNKQIQTILFSKTNYMSET